MDILDQPKEEKSIFQSLTDLEGLVKTAQPTALNKTTQILLSWFPKCALYHSYLEICMQIIKLLVCGSTRSRSSFGMTMENVPWTLPALSENVLGWKGPQGPSHSNPLPWTPSTKAGCSEPHPACPEHCQGCGMDLGSRGESRERRG